MQNNFGMNANAEKKQMKFSNNSHQARVNQVYKNIIMYEINCISSVILTDKLVLVL